MLSCQMLPTAQDSPCTKCPAAQLVPQCCVFQLFPVNFYTCAKKTLIKLSVLAFAIRRKVIKSLVNSLTHAHHVFPESHTELCPSLSLSSPLLILCLCVSNLCLCVSVCISLPFPLSLSFSLTVSVCLSLSLS